MLAPYGSDEARAPGWAAAHEGDIRAQLGERGPRMWYSKIEIVKDSALFTEPNAIETTAETFYASFGYGAEDLVSKRVLDIGAFSGAMSFFAEDSGADVTALDIQDPESNGFGVLHDIRRSTATHVTASIYDLHPDLFGFFDVVIFSGVHYHLKHPLLALERVASVTANGGDLLALGSAGDYWLHIPEDNKRGADLSKLTRETYSTLSTDNINDIPLLGFYRREFMGDDSNWFVPNTSALRDMIGASGFDILTANTFPTYLSGAEAPIACAVIKARKARDPEPEYAPDVYSYLRKFSDPRLLSAGFSIPTWYELEKARRREN